MSPDDFTFLLGAALRDWAEWRARFGTAGWRRKLNNFELSEADALVERMDRAMRDFMSVQQQQFADATHAARHAAESPEPGFANGFARTPEPSATHAPG
ncbi:MAG TPA: hypothetical protein VNU48_12895 [Burkholderiaceae bacterium]|nr:hypothetical protein [Burkholderiaceae bacterium]